MQATALTVATEDPPLLLFIAGFLLLVGIVGVSYLFLKNFTVPSSLPGNLPFIRTPEPKAGEVFETLRIDLNATDKSFEPDEIKVHAGQRVELTLVNNNELSHDFVIEGTDIKTMLLDKDEIDTIVFELEERANYSFYCSVPGHREAGMEGLIVVE